MAEMRTEERVPRRVALARAPGAVLGLVLGWAGGSGGSCRAAAGWPYRRVEGPFVVYSDFRLEGATGLLRELGQLQVDLVRELGIPATRESVQLYWFGESTTYSAYLRRHFPNVPPRRALFIKHDGPGMMLAHLHPDFAVDVRHECTHALLHAVLPLVPLWLDEGLAEYYEVSRERRYQHHPHLPDVGRRLRFGRIAELDHLESLADVGQMRLRDYQDAWAWVHFMLHGSPEARAILQGYLADLAARRPPRSLSEQFGRRLTDADGQLRRHIQLLAS